MSTPFYDLASLVLRPSGYKASKVYAQKPLTTDGQLTFSRASNATRVNASGLIETVNSNVPRLDYLNSSCPKLILEPSRTNLLTYNSDFSSGYFNFNSTTASSATLTPEGTANGARLTALSSGVIYTGVTASGAHTFSVFAKYVNQANCRLGFTDSGSDYETTFNIQNGTIVASGSTLPSKIEAYPNGWYRCSIRRTLTGPTPNIFFGATIVAGNFDFYGAQLEAGAYPTSLIKTTSAAVTRLADACSKTGISSLIGQTAGTIFVDFVWNGLQSPAAVDAAIFSIGVQEYGTSSIAISNYSGTMYARVTNGVTAEATINFGSLVAGTRYKAALAYANNDVVFYVNGVSYGSDTSASIPATGDVNLQNAYPNAKSVNQALLFKTRLTNPQLAELTAL